MSTPLGCPSLAPEVTKVLLPSTSGGSGADFGQTVVILVSLFVKGGVLGAYLPFSTVWLDAKGYDARHLAMIALVDSIGSFFLPVVGSLIDKLRSHNMVFVLMLVTLSALKMSYLPAAQHFTFLLILAALTAPLMRAANSVLDSLALYAFTERGHFGRARLVGDLGWGVIALGTGYALDVFRSEDVVFVIFSGLCLFLALFWTAAKPWMVSVRPDSRQMTGDEFCVQARLLVDQFSCVGAVRAGVVLVALGAGGGIIGSFELVLLKHMMGSGLLLGAVKMVGTLGALPVWYYMGPMMDTIGLLNVQIVACVCFTLRVYILGVIQHPWHAFFSEALAGLGGFAAAYCSITIFVGRVVDEDLKGTSQTVIFTLYAGLGAGLGPLAASFIADTYGLQEMFLVTAYVGLAFTVVIILFDLGQWMVGSYKPLEKSILPMPSPAGSPA